MIGDDEEVEWSVDADFRSRARMDHRLAARKKRLAVSMSALAEPLQKTVGRIDRVEVGVAPQQLTLAVRGRLESRDGRGALFGRRGGRLAGLGARREQQGDGG